MGSGDQGAGAQGGKGPGRRWGRDQARWRWRGLRRGRRGGRARDTPSLSPGGAALAPAALEAAAAGERLAGRARRRGSGPFASGTLRRLPPPSVPREPAGPPAGGSTRGGRGTMRRPWGVLLFGALLCAHGKRRRRARADRPAGKVCPGVRPLQDETPESESGTAQAGA